MPSDSKYPSPDGRYKFLIEMWEARASLWVESPALVDIASGQTILKFNDDRWSLDRAVWKSNTVVVMALRKSPGDHRPAFFDLAFDCTALTATVETENDVPFAQIESTLEKLYMAAKRGWIVPTLTNA